MTPGAEILGRLKSAGLHLRAEGGKLKVSPQEAITDELRTLMREHKAELLQALQPAGNDPVARPIERQEAPAPSPCHGVECGVCDHLQQTVEHHEGTRRIFFWRCSQGFEILEGRFYGERVMLAPPECDRFTPWRPGTL